jgi:hypothetical protein
VFKGYNPAIPLQRADGFRFLTQNLGQAFDFAYEKKDPLYPEIHTFCTPYCKLGGDNADCVYQSAWIDGNSVYKVSGTKGTVRFLNFTTMGPRPTAKPGSDWHPLNEPFGDIPQANLLGHNLETDWEGNFELYIGGPKRGPNWLPTNADTRKLFIRQYFDDWREISAKLRIERVGMTEPRPAPTPADFIKAMDWSGNFLVTMMQDNPDWAFKFSAANDLAHPNRFASNPMEIKDPANNVKVDKARGRTILSMIWRLAPDEALLMEFDDPGTFWMLTNMGSFKNSMDYLYRPVSYAPSRTKVDKDGKIRFVLAHDDPGYHNWIDTSGFEFGSVTSRNVLSDKFIDIRTKVVKRDRVAAEMPADSAKVTKDERTKLMLERFHAIQKRYIL